MTKLPTVMLEEDSVQWAALETDEQRFEFAQYVVNTPEEDRPEISSEDAKAALAWMENQK